MDQLEKLAPQVPGLVALIIVIPMFLKLISHQRREAQETLKVQIDTFLLHMRERHDSWVKEMRELHNEHMDARRASRDALEKQMELARETARGNMEMARAITSMADAVNGCPRK